MAGPAPGAAILLLIALSSCVERPAAHEPRPYPPPGRSSFSTVRADDDEAASATERRSLVGALIADRGDVVLAVLTSSEHVELQRLYSGRGCSPQWSDGLGRPTVLAREALGVLGRARDDGLDPADYFEELLTRVSARMERESVSALDLARFDVTLSAGLLRYLRHVHMGRVDPRTIGFRLDVPRDAHDFPALVCSALTLGNVEDAVDGLRPRLAQYRDLRAVVPRYRVLARDSTLGLGTPFSAAVQPGDVSDAVPALRRTLAAVGDLPPDAPLGSAARWYDGALVDALKRFQARHGLEPDGILGKQTVAALRVPLSWRVRQIELTLERLRWLPHFETERLIVLNIPTFRLWAWDMTIPSEAPRFGLDAIVGRALHTQTPVFVEDMRAVIIRPYWNVPRSILRNEILPTLEREGDVLRREDMEIVRGQGDQAPRVPLTADSLVELRRGTLRIRQRPGPKNALGLIKFVFPNREDVYMHGTPAQALFAKRRRDFSHGCVRVADPLALAEWVLQDQAPWTSERILAAMQGTRTIQVVLERPVRVVLFYTTAVVAPEDGTLRFAEDIYRHDTRLDRALTSRAATLGE